MSTSRIGLYPTQRLVESDFLTSLPEHWSLKKLKFVADAFASNVDKKSKEGETSIRLCNYTDVYYNDTVNSEMDFMAATATEDQIIKFQLRAGDTIITKDSEDPNDIAIPTFVEFDMPGVICGYHLSMIRPNEQVDPGFLNRVFQCVYARSYFATRSNGLTRYGLGSQALSNVDVPIPTLPEQTQIAKFLDYETAKIDALIEKQERLISLLQEKRQAVISHAVTKGLNPDAPMRDSGIEWLGEVPAHWEIRQIRYVTSQMGGGTPSKSIEEYWIGNIPWVSPKDMKSDEIADAQDKISEKAVAQSSTKLVPVGSVLIVVRGMILDHSVPTALTTGPVTINQDMKALIPSPSLESKFLLMAMKGLKAHILSLTDSSAHGTKCLSTDVLIRMEIAIPPLIEQKTLTIKLSQKLELLNQLSITARDLKKVLQERRTALISAAVTGKIDVRSWTPPPTPPLGDPA